MARMARVVIPNYPHHVTQRGNRRQKTFFCEDDYRYYIELVSEFSRQSGTKVWAYCLKGTSKKALFPRLPRQLRARILMYDIYTAVLRAVLPCTHEKITIFRGTLMPNHVHLIMVPGEEDGLRATLGKAHRRYTRHINFREGWRGHLWQERFHSFTMDEKYLLSTVRYVERNPVAARLCVNPQDWKWSSARAHLKGEDDLLISVEPMIERVGNWVEYLSDNGDNKNTELIKQHTRTGRPLGSTEFISELEISIGEELAPKRPGRKPDNDK